MDGEIVMYGTTWCPDCKRAKQFFGEQRIHYRWVDIEADEEAMAYVEQVNEGKRIIPTIVFPDGETLIEPSNAELARKLGVNTRAKRDFYEVIIVGGGPTGLTAALYLAREGCPPLVIERGGLGGQVGITERLDNFPGFDEGIGGAEFAQRLTRQAARFGAELLAATDVSAIHRDDEGYWCVDTADGNHHGAQAVLLATGSRYRTLGVPGEEGLIGINVHYCATCDGAFYKGKDVLVVGGGNSGFEEGLFLATRFAKSVTIIDRNTEPKASEIIQLKVGEQDNMRFMPQHRIVELRGAKKLEAALVENMSTGEVVEWHPDGIFVFIGLSPNNELAKELVELDERGFIVTDKTLETSAPGFFAAGDVRAGSTKQAASAAGEGATAALMIREFLKTV